MKIKYKFTLWLSLILIIAGVMLNVLINQVLINNMENNINDSMFRIMDSTRKDIKYRLINNADTIDLAGLKQESGDLLKSMSENYECYSQITDMDGNIIKSDSNIGVKDIIKKGTESAIKGKAVVNLMYTKNGVRGILSYPIFINVDNNYLGVVNINKNYDAIYSAYQKTMQIITFSEIGIFFLIFIFTFIVASKITTPITQLTEAVKKVGEGDYGVSIKVKHKDEVGILSREFLSMKDKIDEQMQTIRLEKMKVERLEKSRSEFFNRVTHELKTPLTAITGYAEMILEGMVDDKEFNDRAIERIHSEGDRLHKLVLDLIDVSRGLSSIEEESKTIKMGTLLSHICEDMSIKARKYSFEILRNICDGEIIGKPNKIKEVIINIIDNAIKYSAYENKIIVRSRIDRGFYIIEVVNSGGPIKEQIYDHIFEPFVRSENSIEKQSRGLGLFICKEIVKEHDGKIAIENGEKIKITIKFPCC